MIYYYTIFDIQILRDIIISIVIILLFYITPFIVINKYLKSPLLALALVLYLNILLNYIFLKDSLFYYIVCIGMAILFIKSNSIYVLSKTFKFINQNKILLVLFMLYILGHIRITNDGTIFLAGSGDLRQYIQGALLSVISQMNQMYPSLPHNLYVLTLTTPFIVSISPFVFNIIFKIFLLTFFYIYLSYNSNYSVKEIIIILSLSFGFIISVFFLVYIISTMMILQPKVFWNLPNYGLPSKFLVPIFMLNENGGEHAMLFILLFPFVKSPLDILGIFLLVIFFQTPLSLFLIPLIILTYRYKSQKYNALVIVILVTLTVYALLTQAVQAVLYNIIIKPLSMVTTNILLVLLIYIFLFILFFFAISVFLKMLIKNNKIYILILISFSILLFTILLLKAFKLPLYYIILIVQYLALVVLFLVYKRDILLKDTILQYFVLLTFAGSIFILIIDIKDITRLYIFLVLSMFYFFLKFLNLKKIHYAIKIFAITAFIFIYLIYSLLWIYVESGIGPLYHLSSSDLIFINRLGVTPFCAFNTSIYPPKTFFGVSYYDVACGTLIFDTIESIVNPYKTVSIGYLGLSSINDVTYVVYKLKLLNHYIYFLCVNNTYTWFTTVTFYYYNKQYGDLTCTLYTPVDTVLILRHQIAFSRTRPGTQYIFIQKP